MNAFDLKHTVLAPHAQHPVIVHFPIALFMMSYVFDVLGVWRRNPALVIAARYNLNVAALAAPLALLSGLIAWQWKHEGEALKGNLRLHLVGALCSAGLIWALCWRRRSQQTFSQSGNEESPNAGYFGLGLCTLIVIALTAHLGGVVAG